MSAIKNLLYDYMEARDNFDYKSFTSQDFLKFKAEYLTPTTPIPPIVIEFFDAIIPKSDYYKRWIMLINKTDSANFGYNSMNDFLIGYSRYAPMQVNTFFSPCLYDGWYTSSHARLCKVIFLDIDGITDIDLLNMSASEISEWLCDTYNVPPYLLPNWCICTGHGVHLYFIVDEMDFTDTEQSRLRDYYTQMLICYFHADITCRNRNHILRLPFSNNCKQEAMQTKLHRLNNSTDTSLARLDYFYCSSKEVETYKQDSYKIISEKSARTREQNKTDKPNFTEIFPEKKVSKPVNDKICHTFCVAPETMDYFVDFKPHARYWNIIKDLHNYYVRHKGNIFGCRNVFIHIMATLLKKVGMPLDEACDFIEPYCTIDFLKEAIRTVKYIYTPTQDNKDDTEAKYYHYNNESIALLLGFTEIDYASSYSCFNEASRKERKRESNRRAKDKQLKEKRTRKQLQKEYLHNFISENLDMPSSEIAILFDISTRTVQRIKKKIRESQ